MHKKIRRGVFETASSSVHTIIIGKGEINSTLRVEDEDYETLYMFPGEFGCGPERIDDAPTKASYAYTWLQYSSNREKHQQMLTDVLKENTNAKKIIYNKSSDKYSPDGHIDDNSTDVGEKIFESKQKLTQFIFNSKSILFVYDDNSKYNEYENEINKLLSEQ